MTPLEKLLAEMERQIEIFATVITPRNNATLLVSALRECIGALETIKGNELGQYSDRARDCLDKISKMGE